VKPIAAKYGCLVVCDSVVEAVWEREYVITTATLIEAETCAQKSASAPAAVSKVKKGMDDSQITGCAVSYSKKYALCGLFAIDDSSADPDDPRSASMKPQPVPENTEALQQEYLQELDAYCYRAQADFDTVLGRQLAFFKVNSVAALSAQQLRTLIDKCTAAGR